MSDKKNSHPQAGESKLNPETADMLSKQRRNKEKSEQQHYPAQDKRKLVREEHTNGSTPSNRS